jgi:Bacterial Ig-like domain (group 3)
VSVGKNITLKATVAAASGNPTGTVAFYSVADASFFQATLLGTAPVGPDGIASFAVGTVQSNVGAYYAEYSGSTGFSPSLGGPVKVVPPALLTTTTLVASSIQIEMGSPVTLTANVTPASGVLAGGTVKFAEGETTLGERDLISRSSSLTISTLFAGSHTITARYLPPSGSKYSTSTSAPITVTVAALVTTTTLVASDCQINLGSNVTLTANVTTASGVRTGGIVAFMDGTTSRKDVDLVGAVSSLTISTLSAGSHSITATYQPQNAGVYTASTSAAVTVKVSTPDFTLTAKPASLTVAGGSIASTTLNINPLYGFSGSPTMTCSGLPSGASCVFGSPAAQTDGSTNIPISITTATTKAELEGIGSHAGFSIAFLPLLFCLGRRRKAFIRGLGSFALIAAVAVIGLGGSGCGGGSGATVQGGQPVSTPTTSVVTVTATSTGITHQVQIALTVN